MGAHKHLPPHRDWRSECGESPCKGSTEWKAVEEGLWERGSIEVVVNEPPWIDVTKHIEKLKYSNRGQPILSASATGRWQLPACGQWGGKPKNLAVPAKATQTKVVSSSYPTQTAALAFSRALQLPACLYFNSAKTFILCKLQLALLTSSFAVAVEMSCQSYKYGL